MRKLLEVVIVGIDFCSFLRNLALSYFLNNDTSIPLAKQQTVVGVESGSPCVIDFGEFPNSGGLEDEWELADLQIVVSTQE